MNDVFTSSDAEARARLLRIIQDFLSSESAKFMAQEKGSFAALRGRTQNPEKLMKCHRQREGQKLKERYQHGRARRQHYGIRRVWVRHLEPFTLTGMFLICLRAVSAQLLCSGTSPRSSNAASPSSRQSKARQSTFSGLLFVRVSLTRSSALQLLSRLKQVPSPQSALERWHSTYNCTTSMRP